MKSRVMGANVFTRALEHVKNIKSEEGIILTKPFLDLCKHLLPLIDSFGPSLSYMKSDIASNIVKMESKYSSDPSKYFNLYVITEEEAEAKTARSTSSCTNAFVWLNRSMDFLVQLFQNLLEHPQWSMTQACTDSYKKTLKKWHGWMASSTFKVLMKLIPERNKFMETVGVNDEVSLDIVKFYTNFAPVLEENHKFLESLGVHDLKVS